MAMPENLRCSVGLPGGDPEGSTRYSPGRQEYRS